MPDLVCVSVLSRNIQLPWLPIAITLSVCLFVCPQSKFRYCGLATAINSDSDNDLNPNPIPNPNPNLNQNQNLNPSPNPSPDFNPHPIPAALS